MVVMPVGWTWGRCHPEYMRSSCPAPISTHWSCGNDRGSLRECRGLAAQLELERSAGHDLGVCDGAAIEHLAVQLHAAYVNVLRSLVLRNDGERSASFEGDRGAIHRR